jgi:uncharacterized protein (DUF1697 family)
MADLRALLASLGYADAVTHLRSGNVVLSSDEPPTAVADALSAAIESELGLDVAVIIRTRDELADVIERDPLKLWTENPKRYQVTFLSDAPAPKAVAAATGVDVAPERFVISGRELYTWHPDGIHNSKLVKVLSERKLGVVATARNWSTVTALLAMADGG